MIRGTTPVHTFILPLDTSEIEEIRVLYSQNGEVKFVKAKKDFKLDGSKITVKLSQQETLSLAAVDLLKIQARILTKNNDALASRPVFRHVEDLEEDVPIKKEEVVT